jgi:hypothetical protein
MDQKRLRRILRRITLISAVLGAIYLWNRFEVITMPEDRCSPLLRLAPGNKLWVDRRPGGVAVGDVLFFTIPDGGLGIAEVERIDREGERYWMAIDNPDCPVSDSDQFGWISREAVEGRMMMATDR